MYVLDDLWHKKGYKKYTYMQNIMMQVQYIIGSSSRSYNEETNNIALVRK